MALKSKAKANQGQEAAGLPSVDKAQVGDVTVETLQAVLAKVGGEVNQGDCGAFALALVRVLGPKSSVIVADGGADSQSIDHVAVGYGGSIFDADGEMTLDGMLGYVDEGTPDTHEILATDVDERGILKFTNCSENPEHYEALLRAALAEIQGTGPAAPRPRLAVHYNNFGCIQDWAHQENLKTLGVLKEMGFEFDLSSHGYFVKFKGQGIGGAGTVGPTKGRRWPGSIKADSRQYLASALSQAMDSKFYQ